jgi:hypothetical protein
MAVMKITGERCSGSRKSSRHQVHLYAQEEKYATRTSASEIIRYFTSQVFDLDVARSLAVWIGEAAAGDVAVFTGSIVILLITFACIGWIPARSVRTLLLVGLTRVVLTIALRIRSGPPGV